MAWEMRILKSKKECEGRWKDMEKINGNKTEGDGKVY